MSLATYCERCGTSLAEGAVLTPHGVMCHGCAPSVEDVQTAAKGTMKNRVRYAAEYRSRKTFRHSARR